ncbi:MAG: hypothetical protein ACLVKR_05205 [Lachnospiraceae bacterium]
MNISKIYQRDVSSVVKNIPQTIGDTLPRMNFVLKIEAYMLTVRNMDGRAYGLNIVLCAADH